MGEVIGKLCCSNDSKYREVEDYQIHLRTSQNTRRNKDIYDTSKAYNQCPPYKKLSDSFQQVFELDNQFLSEFLSESLSRKSSFNQNLIYEDVKKYYNIGKEIGYGKYGIVRLAAKKSFENKRFALKSIPREKMQMDLEKLETEFQTLITVDHPNIIKVYEIYVDQDFFHLVTEFCGGGELFQAIIERGKISESYSAKIVKQILSAIKHLHDNNICHRDLKPENIIFESRSKDADIKLIDFGLSKTFSSDQTDQKMNTRIGTPYYMAPEVIEGEYDKTCDMWSIGVITYCLLCGYPPFNAENDTLLFRKIKLCDYEFYEPEWNFVSQQAKNFIRGLIQPDPKLRMTPEQALAHEWLSMTENYQNLQISKQVLTRLSMFKQPNAFQREILILLSHLLNSKELKEIKETFSAIDADSSGAISVSELSQAFLKAGHKADDIEGIINKVDFDKNGEINYTEFISGALDCKLLSKQNMWKVFKYLDIKNQDALTYESLKHAFIRKGDFSLEKFDLMAAEVGLKSSKVIGSESPSQNLKLTFQNFLELMGMDAHETTPSVSQFGQTNTKTSNGS